MSGTPNLNPYAIEQAPHEPSFGNVVAGGEKNYPTPLRVIAIVFLIFGCIGLLYGPMQILQGIVYTFMKIPSTGDDTNLNMIKVMTEHAWTYWVMGLLCLVISIPMAIAGIGLLRRSRWALGFTGVTAMAAIVYKVIDIGLQFFTQSKVVGSMQTTFTSNNPNVDPTILNWSMFIGVFIGVLLFGLPPLGFYVWSSIYCRKPGLADYFSKKPSTN